MFVWAVPRLKSRFGVYTPGFTIVSQSKLAHHRIKHFDMQERDLVCLRVVEGFLSKVNIKDTVKFPEQEIRVSIGNYIPARNR